MMSTAAAIDPAGLDLNLLRAFDAVHATGNVTRAAERLGVSQPTVSHALAKLRRALHDPLFVRSQRGVTVTPKGQRLAAAVDHALRTLDAALRDEDAYDPLHSEPTRLLSISYAVFCL